MSKLNMGDKFTGNNEDAYHGQGKIWEIAHRYNSDSIKHTFDRFGNQLSKEIFNERNEKVIVSKKESRSLRCEKTNGTVNVSRRKVSEKDYKSVPLL